MPIPRLLCATKAESTILRCSATRAIALAFGILGILLSRSEFTALALRHVLANQMYWIGVLNPELIVSVVARLGAVAFTVL